MDKKCSSLVALVAAAGAFAPNVAKAAVPESAATNLQLSSAVKTATALPYLGKATSIRDTFSVDIDSDHVHGLAPEASAEGSFQS